LPDGGLLTVMFLNVDMKRIRTGIENVALLRARLFEQHLGIVPQILTVKYDAHFAETQDALCRTGFVTTNAIFRNLYDYFQLANCDEFDWCRDRQEEPAADESWRVVPVAGAADTRVFDAHHNRLRSQTN
jgi:hypothetical protein